MTMSAVNKLPEDVLRQSRVLDELGIQDRAWRWDQLGSVLAALVGKGVVILGGDVYEESDGRAVPTYDSWHCDRDASEPFQRYAERSIKCAQDYISAYRGSANRSLLVSLVFAEERDL
jgi:hypothetical protein